MSKKKKKNPFYFMIRKNRGLNDWFQFHVYVCNFIGITIAVVGYGFDVGFMVHDVSRGRR